MLGRSHIMRANVIIIFLLAEICVAANGGFAFRFALQAHRPAVAELGR